MTAVDRAGLIKYEAQRAADLADEISRNQSGSDKLVKDLTAMATRSTRKSVKAVRGTPPAFIDAPGRGAPLQEWIEFRDQLARSGIPGIAAILRDADRAIARLRAGADALLNL